MLAPPPTFFVGMPRCPAGCARGERDACTYRVAWSINPHMRVGSVDSRRALRQHGTFRERLRELGANVVALPFVHGAYDSVFAKDCALIVQRGYTTHALLANPRHEQRRAEQLRRQRDLERAGAVVERAMDGRLEGGDVVMLPDGRALLGYGYRSDRAMASHLARFLDREVTPLGLANPHLYHLDMALAVLDEQTALVCEAAFDAAALPVLRRALAGYRVLSVTLDEAMSFAVNCVTVGTSVLKAMRHPRIDTALERWGYHVVTTPLGEFHWAGGSAACLVSRVHLLPPLAAQRNAS